MAGNSLVLRTQVMSAVSRSYALMKSALAGLQRGEVPADAPRIGSDIAAAHA